jgi:hypothetical protein
MNADTETSAVDACRIDVCCTLSLLLSLKAIAADVHAVQSVEFGKQASVQMSKISAVSDTASSLSLIADY